MSDWTEAQRLSDAYKRTKSQEWYDANDFHTSKAVTIRLRSGIADRLNVITDVRAVAETDDTTPPIRTLAYGQVDATWVDNWEVEQVDIVNRSLHDAEQKAVNMLLDEIAARRKDHAQ